MRRGYEPGGILEGFSDPVPFVVENLSDVPNEPGVHMVWGPDGEPLYVGMTKTQRDRIRMHLTSDRIASVLHKKVGDRLDEELGHEASRDEIRSWLGQCEFAWKSSDDRQGLKARIMTELEPVLNEVKPIVDESPPERSTWDLFIDWARVFYEDPEFASIERDYKINLASEVRAARGAFENHGEWLDLLQASFRSRSNNLTRWSQHDAYLTWASEHPEDAAAGLRAIWNSTGPVAERIDGFMQQFPTDALSGVGLRTTIASVLLLGDDPTAYPPYKPTVLADGYRLVGYPSAPSGSDEAATYEHALGFFDRIVAEAAARGLTLHDRLDAQAVLWSVLKNDLPASASDEQRKDLALYRGEFRPVWWVNQGATYAEEKAGGYVWAPAKTKAGFPVKHHTDVARMKRGDIVVHYAKGNIRAIGLVTKAGHTAERPSALPTEAWQNSGYRANVRYFELGEPIALSEIPIDARESESSAFTAQGAVKQGYLFGLSQEFSEDLREQFLDRWPSGSPWHHRPPSYWLFQARPDVWDLAEYVATHGPGDVEDWVVTRYRNELEPGDGVLLWQAGKRAGVYAVAEIEGEPFERTESDNLVTDADRTEWAVNLRMVDTSMSPIPRSDLIEHAVLQHLAVIKNAQGTNFKVTPEQWDAVQDLIHDVHILAVAVTEEAGFPGTATTSYGWDQWHSDYNLIGRGDRIIFATNGSDETTLWLQASVSSDGVYETEGGPRYRVDITNLAEVTGVRDAALMAALARSETEGGRGVLVVEPTAIGGATSLEDVVDTFSAAVRASNLDYGTRHDDLIRAFTVSLATKRFVLLTGLSGSGKTRLAMAFGQWLGEGHYQIEAVRPDWTGPDALLGYEDGLSELTATGRAWHVPRSLKFMLRAAHDPQHAYLLVLDEMNLAHVERYFADVLSGMESDQPILPNLDRDDAGEWRLIEGAADRVPFPSNLFVVGTVNIDETTYMFSPKVLDRANTLEFRVRTEDLIVHAQPPDDVVAGPEDLIATFLDAASRATNSWDGGDTLARHLQGLHRILSQDDREFGHRVFFEAQRFGALLAQAGEDDVLKALDLQVMQKILPRFHGSLRQLAGPLSTVGEWAYRLETSADGFDPLGESVDVEQAKLPISFDKIRRMTRRLRANHFVSFAE